uniref:Uncharacterized protein n=1 Tax=Vespula pensylvanica TaxID=30213 RepID=A0A834NIV8_VESPE|nr:hypothetical protein H0235_013267 [Vespula pensylvanica]
MYLDSKWTLHREIRRFIKTGMLINLPLTRSISPRDRARSGLLYARLSKLGSGTRPLLVRRKEGLRPIRCHRYNRLYSRGTFAMFIRVSRFYRPDYTARQFQLARTEGEASAITSNHNTSVYIQHSQITNSLIKTSVGTYCDNKTLERYDEFPSKRRRRFLSGERRLTLNGSQQAGHVLSPAESRRRTRLEPDNQANYTLRAFLSDSSHQDSTPETHQTSGNLCGTRPQRIARGIKQLARDTRYVRQRKRRERENESEEGGAICTILKVDNFPTSALVRSNPLRT